MTVQQRIAKNVCMLTHSFYESDNRVMRYAEALAERGDRVEVIALRRAPTMAQHEVLNGVTVHRLQDRFHKTDGSPFTYLWPLLRFQLRCRRWLARRGAAGKTDLVHVHNIPDFLVFSARPARRAGAKIILDIHDIVPEFFASKFTGRRAAMMASALKRVERASGRFADHVILSNHLWLERYAERSVPADRCSVFINYVDRSIFVPRQPRSCSPAPVIIFPGGLHWHQGLDIAIRAFARLREKLPQARFHIYGDGSCKAELFALAANLGLSDSVKFFDSLSLREIAGVMAAADLGVVPKRADGFGNEAYSTKIMEFMSIGVPVVISATRIDRYYFDDGVARFFPSGDTDELARAMYEVLTDEGRRQSLSRNALAYADANSWERKKVDYLRLVDDLCAGRAAAQRTAALQDRAHG